MSDDSGEQGMSNHSQIEAAYREHADLVRRRARCILGNHDDAEEVVQEVFARWWQRPRMFGGRARVTTWLYSVTTRRCLNLLRDRARHARLLADNTEYLQPCAPTADPADARLCREVLSKLSPQLATLAVYRFVDGLLVREIAELMGLRERRIAQLLAKLKLELARHGGEPLENEDPLASPKTPRRMAT